VKRTVVFVLVAAALSIMGCASTSEPSRTEPSRAEPRQVSAAVEEVDALRSTPARGDCENAGGTCRKSACRLTERRSDLECGTERGCCLPVQ
jgi:hypothetical protein